MLPVVLPFVFLLVLLAATRARNPVEGAVLVSRQGQRPSRRTWHNGIDLSASAGSAIFPIFDGSVEHICVPGVDCCGYGNAVLVRHADDLFSFYAHMERVDVAVGQTVTQSTQLGTVGGVFGLIGEEDCPIKEITPHLHLEIQHGGFPFAQNDYGARYDVLQVLAASGLRINHQAQLEATEPFDYEEPALVAARNKSDAEIRQLVPEIASPALRYGRWYTIGLPLGISAGIAGLSALGIWIVAKARRHP